MTTKLQEIARAICKSRTCEGFNCCQWPANGGRTSCPVRNGGYDDAARAAVEAMRTATSDMVADGAEVEDCHGALATETIRLVWCAMIDSILSEKETE